ncbi:dye-decolorizing peroxidase YfeX-like [Ptychodera flava]|uniref:dye-decolorizing peroxidase YfeX-like n=1 Tax=Ptychodera flava TaxID=63121 RepID=UPI003969E78B
MASLRHMFTFSRSAGRRLLSTQSGRFTSGRKLAYGSISAAALAGTAYGLHSVYKKSTTFSVNDVSLIGTVSAAASSPQPSVISGTKEHALYLWIHLKPTADAKQCAKVVANLQSHVDVVCPPDLRDEDDEVLAGVAFGPNFIAKVQGKPRHNFTYPERKGPLGAMPSSGGDIFIHAKSHSYSKLYELSQRIVRQLPAGSIEKAEDIYGWVYQNGRDLSGFIDGTENPADDDSRFDVAIDKVDGSSYLITQKWIHRHDAIQKEKDKVKEGWVGRSITDSTELSRKPASSHVARMTGGTNFQQKKVFEIVRQSQPYGTVTGESGLFFIAYAAAPENFEYMLDRMVGADKDGQSDDVMRMSDCVKGTYWYVPSQEELKRLK